MKALKRILDIKDEDVIDNFETKNKKGHINPIRKKSTGGLNPTDIHHYDEIREVVLDTNKVYPTNFCVLFAKTYAITSFFNNLSVPQLQLMPF